MNRFLLSAVVLFAFLSDAPVFRGAPSLQSARETAISGKHFDRVLIIVLENEGFVSATKDSYLDQLASEGVEFTGFKGATHPSYPNYLAMISGSTFCIHGLFGDFQENFEDDSLHKTIADLLDWRNYAEDYPAHPGQPPYLHSGWGKYARKHVPFLSFEKIQKTGYQNVVSVDPSDPNNSFVTDVANSRRDPGDPKYKPLPRYMFYSPNLIDDGHNSDLPTASAWLRRLLENWFPRDARHGTLVVITFDEGEGSEWNTNHICTIFIGDMVKKGYKDAHPYDHFSVLRTIEDNFGLQTLNGGDTNASVINEIWK
jgi:hypothetical protein